MAKKSAKAHSCDTKSEYMLFVIARALRAYQVVNYVRSVLDYENDGG